MTQTNTQKNLVFIVLVLLVVTAGAYLIVLVLEDGLYIPINTAKPSAEPEQVQQAEKPTTETPVVETAEETEEAAEDIIKEYDKENEEEDEEQEETDKPIAPSNTCLADFNLTSDTIIFFYLDEPHSNSMKPIVQELSSTYDFFWKEQTWDHYFNNCFDHDLGTVPAFVCAGTNEKLRGEVSKETLAAFADSCS